MKTAIINSESYEKHNTGDGHPEQPKRVIAIKEKLKKRKDLIWDKPDNVPEKIEKQFKIETERIKKLQGL